MDLARSCRAMGQIPTSSRERHKQRFVDNIVPCILPVKGKGSSSNMNIMIMRSTNGVALLLQDSFNIVRSDTCDCRQSLILVKVVSLIEALL